jgi:hypothetical protein
MKTPWSLSVARGIALCASLAVTASAAAYALTAPDLPPEHQQGNIAFRTGGIGEDEAKAMQDAAHQYPLALEFVARTGEEKGGWLAGVDVSIKDGGGNVVLRTTADGPFLLARLPAGHYVVTARYQDAQRSQPVEVSGRKSKRVVFGW